MTDTKLSSDEVPAKFADWLLAMGCPPEKVPTVDKISQMCRGTYYLVWRSLMEQVESKETIRLKRLQVFADDVRRCKKKNLFTEHDSNVLIPPELTLWRQQTEARQKVKESEARVAEARKDLNEIMDKLSTKMSQRNLARQRVQDLQRRGWLLQLLAEDLRAKKQNLAETRNITEDMCTIQEHTDVQPKLDKYLSSLRRQPQAVASSTMISSSSVNVDNDEEHITQLVQCRGDALWAELYARRAALVASLSNKGDPVVDNNRPSFQTVLSHTAAMQCTLALEALKCREMTRLAQQRLALAADELNSQLSSESCELLVLRCERARTSARSGALRAALRDVTARAGLFACPPPAAPPDTRIQHVDKAIESKKEEIKSVISSLAVTERKIQNARECLVAIFNGFRNDTPVGDIGSGRGIQLDLPTESIATLRQFYEQRRGRHKMELSMEFDVSENSFNELSDLNYARFIDELRIYLKKFNLEKNRKLILDSGEKIWIFETLQSSVTRLHSRCAAADACCALLCPAESLRLSLTRLAARPRGPLRKGSGGQFQLDVDINKHTDEEDQIIDKVKKRLDENLRSLHKTSKTLDQGKENLSLWSDNKFKNHISHHRTVDGKPYKAYEAYFLESLSF